MNKPAGGKRERSRLDISGLGLSLSDLATGTMPDTEASAAGAPATIRIDLIDEDASQPRSKFAEGPLQELAESIKSVGMQMPILVHPQASGRYLLLQGGRRYRACKLLGMTEIAALFASGRDPYAQMVENLQREDLTPIEIARFIGRELDNGRKQSEIAERLGKSKVWVSKFAALARAPDFISTAAEAGRLESVEGLYEIVVHWERHAGDREALEAAITGGSSLTRSEVTSLLARLRLGQETEAASGGSGPANSGGAAPGRGGDQIISGRLSRARRPVPEDDEKKGGDTTAGASPGVRQHATQPPAQGGNSSALESEASTEAEGSQHRVLKTHSGGSGGQSSELVSRGATAGDAVAIRAPKLTARYGIERVTVDLTRIPPEGGRYLYVTFGNGGIAVATGDALSDLILSEY